MQMHEDILIAGVLRVVLENARDECDKSSSVCIKRGIESVKNERLIMKDSKR